MRACFLLASACALALLPPAPAQAPASPSAAERALTAALEAYAKVRDGDETARTAAVSRLGRHDDARVATILLEELRRATTPAFRRTAIGAVGQHRRPGATPLLIDALEAAGEDSALASAAGTALGRQGGEAVDYLLARLPEVKNANGKAEVALRAALYAGLGAADTPAARAALGEIAIDGQRAPRLLALTQLARATADDQVTRARLAALDEDYEPLLIQGLRQLTAQGYAGLGTRAVELHREHERSENSQLHVAILHALASDLRAETWAALFDEAAIIAPEIDRAVDELCPRLAQDAAFVGWLLERGVRHRDPRHQAVAIRMLARAEGEGITAALLRFVRGRRPEVVLTAVRALGDRGDPAAIPALRELLAAKGADRKVEAIRGLHGLLGADPTWQADLLPLLDARNPVLRTLAMDLLAELGAEAALPTVWKDLDAKAWPVRAAAYDFVRKVRSAASIPRLIARIDAEDGRLREDVLDALYALTRLRYLDTARWRAWWRDAEDGFVLPPPPEPAPKPKRGAAESAPTLGFFAIPIVSDRNVFVVDVSGSMAAKMGTGNNTRIAEAKRQLELVVDALPAKHRFNIVSFHTTITPVHQQLQPATPKAKQGALAAIAALAATGGTNIHGALQRAFADPDVDTIYLLSDGYPSAGDITDPQALADAVREWNRTRRVRIHGIAIGLDSPLLRRLADESGGKYRYLR